MRRWLRLMDRRALAALCAGMFGLALGVAALLLDAPLLGVLAGVAALGGATAALALGGSLRHESRSAFDARFEAARLAAEVSELRETQRVRETLAELPAFGAGAGAAGATPYVDSTTGLLDARYFEPALQSRVAAARRLLRPVSVVLLQVERDTGGAGGAGGAMNRDAVLRSFAAVLSSTLREADTACRLEGDRFALILEDTPEGGGVWAAERIRAGFARDGGPVQLLSAGVAAYPSHALDADELLERAQRALGRARASGRGQVEIAAAD
jgi:diguanylate cyclase (GGDEF)-like protein